MITKRLKRTKLPPTTLKVKVIIRSDINGAPTVFYSTSQHFTDHIRPIEISKLQYRMGFLLNQGLKLVFVTNMVVVVGRNEDRFLVGGNHRTYISTKTFSSVCGYMIRISSEIMEQILKVEAEEMKRYDACKPETSIIGHVLKLRDYIVTLLPR